MERKQDKLLPIGEAFGGLAGLVDAVCEASPQARRHYGLFDQVDALVRASETDPEPGFMARWLMLCTLPRSNPGSREKYVRRNGPYTLVMTAGHPHRLPFGNLPRLLAAWVCTEAVRTQSRVLVLGRSLSEFMRKLDIEAQSGGRGGVRTRLRNQMQRFFSAQIRVVYQDKYGERFISSAIADEGEFWWNERRPDDPVLFESKIELGEKFFEENHQPSGPAGHKHAEGAETVASWPRPVHVAGLPDIQPRYVAAAVLADALPAIRGRPESER